MTHDTPPRLYISTLTDGLAPRYRAEDRPHMGAEEYVPKGSGVRVRALEWEALGGNCAWRAQTGVPGVTYRIERAGAVFALVFSVPGMEIGSVGEFPTLEAAKSAAQADYEARILAALEPVAQPETEAVASDTEQLARRFHDLYEQLAPSFGYATRPETRAFDPESPNGKLMIAVCGALQPTPGQFTTMCLAIEDVVTGRGFDVAIPEAVKAYLRNALMVGGWRGERE